MKKKVDVFCASPFVIGHANFAGKCLGCILEVEDIRKCLLSKAFVWELTPEGKRIPLDFSNYRLDNGGVVDNSFIVSNDIRMKTNNVTSVEIRQKDDGTTEVVKEKKVVVQKKEILPKIMKEEKKEEVKEDKKPETVVADIDVTAKIEEKKEEVKEDKKFDKFNNNKHNNKK